jgi:hypothetical protein
MIDIKIIENTKMVTIATIIRLRKLPLDLKSPNIESSPLPILRTFSHNNNKSEIIETAYEKYTAVC